MYVGSSMAAGFLTGLLEDAGIETFVWDETRRGALWPVGFKGPRFGVRIVVAKRDLEKAEPIVQQFFDEK